MKVPRLTKDYKMLAYFKEKYGTRLEDIMDEVKTFDGWTEVGRKVKPQEKSFRVFSRKVNGKPFFTYYFHLSQTETIGERYKRCGVKRIDPAVYQAMIEDGLHKETDLEVIQGGLSGKEIK